jgi:hypothetical protein
MELGSAGHKAIEDQGKLGTYKFDRIINTEEQNQIEGALKAIIPAYQKFYAKSDTKYQQHPEHVFDVKFNGVRLRGKVDNILSYGSKVKIRETKFKSRISEDGLDKGLALDWQSLFYVTAVMLETGTQPQSVEYDVVRYPSIKFGMKPEDIYEKCVTGIRKEPENWFMRWETKFDEVDIMSFTGELIQKLNELKDRKIWYRNECACNSMFPCPYIALCTSGDKSALIKKELFSELKK